MAAVIISERLPYYMRLRRFTPTLLTIFASMLPKLGVHSLRPCRCLHLLQYEKEYRIRLNLARALLSQFAPEGIAEARKLLVGRELNFENRDLRNYLLETCAIMGERFPEYDEWRAIPGKRSPFAKLEVFQIRPYFESGLLNRSDLPAHGKATCFQFRFVRR